ncbi:MAG: hypothetical protein GXO04_03775 [Aquificae bacterium]|nr:hypothetical protein [Aquificota bacterium]
MGALMKLTHDTPLSALLEFLPESKQILYPYGLEKIEKDGVWEIVVPRLSVRGFMNLMNLPDEKREELWAKLEELYNKKLTEEK